MSNNQATACDAPEKPGTFFDKTEQNYNNIMTRARDVTTRVDVVCDQINGGQPREAGLKGSDADRHPAAFDRCNAAESRMYDAMNVMEDSITRLEQLGLTQ